MILTYYEYINEGRGISNFIKPLSSRITGTIYTNRNSLNKIFNIPTDYKEISLIESIQIEVYHNRGKYEAMFKVNEGEDILNNLVIKIDLPHENINPYIVHSTIVHELTHLYEFYNIVKNERQFPLYNRIKKSLIRTIHQDDFDPFIYFRNLVYLTLDNEFNARVAEAYQLLSFIKSDDYDILKLQLEKTSIWKKCKEIEGFPPDRFTSDMVNLIGVDLTCILINSFNIELVNNDIRFPFIKTVKIETDIKNYFNAWNKRFQKKLSKHYKKLDKVIQEVMNDERE